MLYDVEQKTHKLVKKLANQEGVKIKIKKPMIQAPEICQILKAFEGVLGENPDYDYDVDFWGFSDDEKHLYSIDRLHNLAYEKGFENGWRFRKPKTLSQALWEKYNSFTWSSKAPLTVGGLYRGEEGLIAVLEDLNLILKSKIK